MQGCGVDREITTHDTKMQEGDAQTTVALAFHEFWSFKTFQSTNRVLKFCVVETNSTPSFPQTFGSASKTRFGLQRGTTSGVEDTVRVLDTWWVRFFIFQVLLYLQNDTTDADDTSRGEDPEKEAVQHEGYVLPVLPYLQQVRPS